MTSAPHPHPAEIEAWITEVRPVVQVLRRIGRPPSPGQRHWLAEQVQLADDALDLLDCASYEAETAQVPCDELHWLHTQVCALLEGLHQVERSGSLAA